ncbi:CARDB domain-containing protein [Peptostreptococcaceae bacterium AGR-M142]
MKIKKFSFIMIYILLFNLFINIDITYADEKDRDNANLVIVDNEEIKEFEAGKEANITLSIENDNEDGRAYDVKLSPVVGDAEEYPFIIESKNMNQDIGNFSGGEKRKIDIKMTVSLDAKPKIYPVTFKLEHKNLYDQKISDEIIYYIKVKNDKVGAILGVNKVKLNGDSLVAGRSQEVTFTIKNNGDRPAKNIKVYLTDNEKITVYQSMNSQLISFLDGKSEKEIKFNVLANEDLESGVYNIPFKYVYYDSLGKEHETTANTSIRVVSEDEREIDFVYENMIYPQEIDENQDFIIAFDLFNPTADDAKKLRVSLEMEDEFLSKSTSIKNIQTLNSMGKQHVEFKLTTNDIKKTKSNQIKIKTEYETVNSNDTKEYYEYISIYTNKDAFDEGKPKLIVNNYSYGSEYIKAGDSFNLNLSFLNTSKSKDIGNVKVTLSSSGDVFLPVGSSNSFFIEKISKSNNLNKVLKLKAKPDADYKIHSLDISLDYQDSSGDSYSEKETIAIPVIQEMRLELSEIELPPEVYATSPTSLYLDYYNMGRATIHNLTIKTEGEGFRVEDGSTFEGKFEEGQDDDYSVTIVPEKEGEITGNIIFEYEDDIGNKLETKKPFTLTAMKYEEPDYGDFDDFEGKEEEPEGISLWYYIGGGVGLVVIIVAILKIRKRKKEKQRELEELELDE